MPPRLRRFIAAVGVLAFLITWIWGAVTISEFLPNNIWIDMVFFIVAGTAWGVPLIPLLRWAEKG